MTFVDPLKSGFPNESPCDVIKLGIPFERNWEFLWRKLNSSGYKDEKDIAWMKNKVPYFF